MASKISFLNAFLGFSLYLVPPARAEGFKHTMEMADASIVIEQAYSEDGVSQPKVSLNGANLRIFSYAQRLTLVLDAKLGGEEVSVIHDWEGGNGCAGNLFIFSLSAEGFYQSPPLGDCTDNYEAQVIKEDGLEMLEIITHRSGSQSEKIGHWHYFDGNLVKK